MQIVVSHAARQLPAWLIFDVRQKAKHTYRMSSPRSFRPRMEASCDKFVRALHESGLSVAQIRRRLGLTPRTPFMRFYHAKDSVPASAVERDFVEEMRALGVEERNQWYIGTDSGRSWSEFPEAHDYLILAVSRLEESIHIARMDKAKKRDLELKGNFRPVSHAPVSLADILGSTAKSASSQKTPNKAPEPTPGSVTPRAIEGASK